MEKIRNLFGKKSKDTSKTDQNENQIDTNQTELESKDKEKTSEDTEQTSKDNEQTSKDNEQTSKDNEQTSKDNEQTSKNNEQTSKHNEQTSKNNEQTSKDNEQTSKDNEQTSKDNEQTSKDKEQTSKDKKISKDKEPTSKEQIQNLGYTNSSQSSVQISPNQQKTSSSEKMATPPDPQKGAGQLPPFQQQGYPPPPHSYPPQNPLQVNQFANPYPGQTIVYVDPTPQDSHRPGGRPLRPSPHPETDRQFNQSAFADVNVRRIFVRKVYLILTIQLLFTFGVICLFVFEPHVKNFVLTHTWTYWVAMAIFAVVYFALLCIPTLRRSYPTNVISLVIFTLAFSYLFGVMSSMYKTEIVLYAIGITAGVCFLTTLFSFYTKFDFTTCGGILCVLLIVLLIVGIVAIFYPSRILLIVYGSLGAILFTMYLAYDTQMIMGGKTLEISPEEHVLAAITLYIDIMYIYMYILLLFGAVDS